MRLRIICLGLALCDWAVGTLLQPREYAENDFYAVHLESSTDPSLLARSLGLSYEGPLGQLEDHHMLSGVKGERDVVNDAVEELRRRRRKRDVSDTGDVLDGMKYFQKQELKHRLVKRTVVPLENRQSAPKDDKKPAVSVDSSMVKQSELAHSLGIEDPIFAKQWHLYNPKEIGHDVNVTDIWKQGITGKNVTVAIVDDGLDMDSDDLHDNYFAEGSFDFNDKGPRPKPRLSDDKHGTRCAGEIAAVKNNVCGVGVAWDAKVAGLRILSKQISDADEAVAMNYEYQKNNIYSCSWGPPDDGEAMDAPGLLVKKAMVNGVKRGRDGRGSVFVFASGNGAAFGDNCNFDGYTNSIFSITVGAIDRKGAHPYYAEKCSAQLVVTYSSGSGDAIHTTDVGKDKCYDHHGGTSAAAPLAAGIFALVLSARPELTWRDLQYLALDTAVPVNEEDGNWQETTIGKKFSHTYGYGKIDTWAIVEAAKTFEMVKPQAWYNSAWMHVKAPIPQGEKGLVSSVEVTKDDLKDANVARLEHVTVTMNVEHQMRGDLSVELKSPDGVVSHLSAKRNKDRSDAGYQDWTFMSVAHWGEKGIGNWTVIVKDTVENQSTGNFTDWKLTLWGESIDASKAKELPSPTEHDDDDHDATTTAGAVTTSVPAETGATDAPDSKPSNHPDRPVNAKPTAAEESQGTATPTATDSPETSSTPVPEKPGDEHFLPSFFPTFGVSKGTQIWIYGAVAIIVLFCVGLGAYVYLARRKRMLDKSRGDYDFVVDGEEGVPLGVRDPRKGKRRAGELYDAFAGESDEDLFSDDEDAEAYKDEGEDDEHSGQAGNTASEKGEDRENLLSKDR